LHLFLFPVVQSVRGSGVYCFIEAAIEQGERTSKSSIRKKNEEGLSKAIYTAPPNGPKINLSDATHAALPYHAGSLSHAMKTQVSDVGVAEAMPEFSNSNFGTTPAATKADREATTPPVTFTRRQRRPGHEFPLLEVRRP